MITRMASGASAFIRRAFPERQIYHRAEGQVHYISFSTRAQLLAATAAEDGRADGALATPVTVDLRQIAAVETSLQAQYLIPMAISLGFGIVFATAIILLLVPSLYLILEDARVLLGSKKVKES